jgi:RNA polymerase sigma-70 factor (ECF subfamily)
MVHEYQNDCLLSTKVSSRRGGAAPPASRTWWRHGSKGESGPASDSVSRRAHVGDPSDPLTPPAADTADSELVAAVLRRDRKATAELVALHADTVYAYLRARLLPRADVVDDLVQEVFLAAWRNLDAFRGDASLRSWLLGIARHKVQDYYRARLREPEPLEEERAEPPDATAGAMVFDPQLELALDRERLQGETRRVLAELPEPYSLLLLWRYWERKSARDMAAEIGKSEKAVERLLARAREQFKRRWNRA